MYINFYVFQIYPMNESEDYGIVGLNSNPTVHINYERKNNSIVFF